MIKNPAVLLTALEPNERLLTQVANSFLSLRVGCAAAYLTDEPSTQLLDELFTAVDRPDIGAWVILGEPKSFTKPILSALSLTALASRHLRAERNLPELPIILSPSSGTLPPLPNALADASVVTASLAAKTIAMIHTAKKIPQSPYRLDVLPLNEFGLWLEVGPGRDPWEGVLLGVAGAEPDAHGVGPSGAVPQRSTLKYPVKGMKLSVHDTDFTAWGTQNTLTPADSYFVRLTALPAAIVFGPYPADDNPELFVLNLC